MQARFFGGICLLAFLLSEGRAEDLDVDKAKENVVLSKSGDLEAPSDLKNELSLGITQTNSRSNEGRSGDVGESDARRDSAVSNAAAQSNEDGSVSAYAESFSDSAQFRATAIAGGGPAAPFNPFNEELGPYKPPGSSFSQAEAQAINSDAYGQGLNSYPYLPSYPYNSGLNSPQGQAVNGFYKPSPNANLQADSGPYQQDSAYNPYSQRLSPGQAQNQADIGLYQPAYNGQPNVSPYNQGSNFPQVPDQSDSESNQPIIEPNSMLPKSAKVSDPYSALPSSYSYTPVSNTNSAHTQDNSRPYQTIPVPNPNYSPYDRFLVPYKGPSLTQTQGDSEVYQPLPIIEPQKDRYEPNLIPYKQGSNSPYQAIPLPDPNPSLYDSYVVPYRDPYPAKAQSNSEEYQPIPFPKPTNKQQEALARLYSERTYLSQSNSHTHNYAPPQSPDDRVSYQAIPMPNSGPNDPYMVPYIESSYSQKQINNGAYQPVPIPNNLLRANPTQDEINTNQSISLPESDLSRYGSSMVQYREQNSKSIKIQDERNAYEYQPDQNINDPKSDSFLSSSYTSSARSREYNPVIDEIDSSADLKSKSGWNPYKYNPYTPSGAYPKLYPSGAEAAQANPDLKPAASGVYPNSQGISSYASGYPSESPFRPGGYNLAEDGAQGPPNVFASGQSSPIAFEDAKSRAILPNEYVFPNKMPGGENSIQCTKENEFHHFWSQELDCLVCICLNEYGLLQPVCASCGGCHSPQPTLPEPVPQLPESITVQPATPGPFEPVPIMPEPNTDQPIQEPNEPLPTPVYPTPERVTLPPAVFFPEPVATLPPASENAHCNPLPTGVPFTNPLHPCQLCICRESLMSGKTDVQIECKENPQCIVPDDVTALPPIPDVPQPIPLPICEKFPENVLFPHPTETCKLCKCAKNVLDDGDYEQQITCYPHPDCVPKLEAVTEQPVPPLPILVAPVPEPLPTEPLREPYLPMEPVPLPEVVTVEPLPWPPITTVAPIPVPVTPKPGPLPGPSPHESCRPFPPNQTFQHPWDECQVCVCTEATAVGMITVEVNCYTKPSCCIDPPDSVKAALPGKLALLLGFNQPYPALSNAVTSSDQALTVALQPTTSTYRPPPAYASYSPKAGTIYPESNPATDPLNQPPVPPYSGYVDPSSSYPYQPNYPPQYVNPQYPEYPPRLPVLPGTGNTIGQYKPNNFGYPPNYQYTQGDAVGNNYPPQGHYQPFDPRFQAVPAPSYPGMYQRAYDRPHMYAHAPLREGYVKPPMPAIGPPSVQSLTPSYAAPIGYSKSGKDGPDDASR